MSIVGGHWTRLLANRRIEGECWMWGGYRQPNGYARLQWRDEAGLKAGDYVHRLAWIEHNGPVPEGHEVHHLCENRACFRPDHVAARLIVEHRKVHAAARYAVGCGSGHPWTPENTYVRPKTGKRTCQTCRKAARERWRERSVA